MSETTEPDSSDNADEGSDGGRFARLKSLVRRRRADGQVPKLPPMTDRKPALGADPPNRRPKDSGGSP